MTKYSSGGQKVIYSGSFFHRLKEYKMFKKENKIQDNVVCGQREAL